MKLAVETFVCCFIIAAGMFLNVVYCANTKVVSNAKQYQSAAVHKMERQVFQSSGGAVPEGGKGGRVCFFGCIKGTG